MSDKQKDICSNCQRRRLVSASEKQNQVCATCWGGIGMTKQDIDDCFVDVLHNDGLAERSYRQGKNLGLDEECCLKLVITSLAAWKQKSINMLVEQATNRVISLNRPKEGSACTIDMWLNEEVKKD